ncbi:tetratricopeptide repeat-containing sulfotransferase family protein [Algibacillus agarilyticus]|uniref:tetratricopeptide repeat-containing sulfotransferase family protein n=1 Tax=Algibacillus agarilyticus TaxID=2234133 RepID=UPI000DD0E41F|nr:sulfotransferase [Algibacillus agarilyticus]
MHDISRLHQQAQTFLNQQKYQEAHQCCIQILQQQPDFADAYFLLAMIAFTFSNNQKAIDVIHRALKFSPNNAEYQAHLAKCYAYEYDVVQAKKYADDARDQPDLSALTHDTLGVTYSKIGLHKNAVTCFERAVKQQPNNAQFQFNLAAAYKFIGAFLQASVHYQHVLAIEPEFYKAEYALATIRCQHLAAIHEKTNDRVNERQIDGIETAALTLHQTDYQAWIDQLQLKLENAKTAESQLFLAHSLALYFEKLQQPITAFTLLQQGKKAQLTAIDYHFSSDQLLFKQLKSMSKPSPSRSAQIETENKYLNQNLSQNPSQNQSNISPAKPIFVVGMPRSGTTLVERILSNHSTVNSAGELQQFGWLLKKMSGSTTPDLLDQDTLMQANNIDYAQLGQAYLNSTQIYAQDADLFIDKMPLNLLYVGHIIKALPHAQVVCLLRNPLDTIVGNYRQLFAVNYSFYNYAYDLISLANYYVEFYKLAHHWQKAFPQHFKIVNYEQLVRDPQNQITALLNTCGLSTEASCFQIETNQSPVATASAIQVREPINTRSIGRWQKYNAVLSPVKQILQQAGIPY